MNIKIDDLTLDKIINIACKGGDLASDLQGSVDIEKKSNNSLVTEADRRVENFVKDSLEENFEYPTMGEEFGGDIESSNKYWVIDPIDGTKNFSFGQDLYGTAIALVDSNDGPELGVFYMPDREFLFYAKKGEGAFLNNSQLQVSDNKNLSDCYFVISGFGRFGFSEELANLSGMVQSLGCALAGEGWVANKWCDVGVYSALAPWDMAVGKIMVEEAGGIMTNVNTGKSDWNSVKNGKCAFGNKEVVNHLIEHLDESFKKYISETVY